jgi:hypothetical protein
VPALPSLAWQNLDLFFNFSSQTYTIRLDGTTLSAYFLRRAAKL